jgi:multiple sugar transport system substrate-binding protein
LNTDGLKLKRISVLLIFIGFLLFALLAGCQPELGPTQRPKPGSVTPVASGGDEQSKATVFPTASKPTPTPSPTVSPESLLGIDPSDLKGTTVQYWHVWAGDAGRLTGKLVDEFNETNRWGVIVEATYVGNFDTLNEQILTAIPEGDTPDLSVAFDYQASAWDAQNDTTVDIAAYVSDPLFGWNEAEQADIYPFFWQPDIIEDKLIGVPVQRSGQFLYYNTTWAGELGFRSPPTTTTQFRTQACAAARANQQDDDPQNDMTGGWIISTDYSTISGWLYAFGSQITRPDGNGYRFNTPEVEEALGFLRELYEQGCAWLPEDQPSEDAFAHRGGLFSAGSIMGIPFQQAAFRNSDNDDVWTAIPFPASNNDLTVTVYGPSLVILESTPEEQLASWLFIQWLLSPENQARWVQATASYPLSASALEQLDKSATIAPQWITAVELLKYAHPEPSLSSWDTVRWAVSDAATQLFRWYFTMEQLPDTVQLLDHTAAELNKRSR